VFVAVMVVVVVVRRAVLSGVGGKQLFADCVDRRLSNNCRLERRLGSLGVTILGAGEQFLAPVVVAVTWGKLKHTV
jgi:hypothetical protein